MKIARIYLFIGVSLLFAFESNAQHKFEKEYRIKSEMIPQSAKKLVDSVSADSKIKWYKEISLNGITIEAKFKYKKKKFSIEFDTVGILKDAEFVIKKREIISEVYNNIERKLDSIYQKWSFQKIQIQYNGISGDVVNAIIKNEPSDSINISYEIVLKGKNLDGNLLYEITFNDKGEILDVLQIIQDKADHLEY